MNDSVIKAIKNLTRQEGNKFTIKVTLPSEILLDGATIIFAAYRKDCTQNTTTALVKRVNGITIPISGRVLYKTTYTVDIVNTQKFILTFLPSETVGLGGDTYVYEIEITVDTGETPLTIVTGDLTILNSLIH